MIRTVMRIGWLTLKRDRIAQALTFVLPVGFFSVFALIFGGMGPGQMSSVRLAVVDEDHTLASERFIQALDDDESLRVIRQLPNQAGPLTREQARELVINDRNLSVAVIVEKGFEQQFGAIWEARDPNQTSVTVLADTSDPIAPQVVTGLLQRAAMVALPGLFMERGVDMLEKYGGPLTDGQRNAVSTWLQFLDEREDTNQQAAETTQPSEPADDTRQNPFATGLVQVKMVDLLAAEPDKSPVSAFYAVAVAVLFLLFSTTATAGVLLEEEANGTLERLLTTKMTMGKLLLGRWIYVSILGVCQLTVMFLWGWAVFDVDLWTLRHFSGFMVMTLVTAAAAASFGLVLATACRTRAQLDGLGSILILLMSAVGGSMFPRFLMPAWMKQVGLATFNAWALDGYQKVFWYEKTVLELWPQVAVLAGITVVFLALSRVLARRWESV